MHSALAAPAATRVPKVGGAPEPPGASNLPTSPRGPGVHRSANKCHSRRLLMFECWPRAPLQRFSRVFERRISARNLPSPSLSLDLWSTRPVHSRNASFSSGHPICPGRPERNCRRSEAVAAQFGILPEFSGARLEKTLVLLGSPRAAFLKRPGSACGLSGLPISDWELGSACGFSGLLVGMFSSRRGSACGVSGLPVSRWDPGSACGHSGLPIGSPVMNVCSWRIAGR